MPSDKRIAVQFSTANLFLKNHHTMLLIGAIKIEYENIKFENGEIEKQSGELKAN